VPVFVRYLSIFFTGHILEGIPSQPLPHKHILFSIVLFCFFIVQCSPVSLYGYWENVQCYNVYVTSRWTGVTILDIWVVWQPVDFRRIKFKFDINPVKAIFLDSCSSSLNILCRHPWNISARVAVSGSVNGIVAWQRIDLCGTGSPTSQSPVHAESTT